MEFASADHYFMALYGYQADILNLPRRSHSWGVFIHTVGDGFDLTTAQLIEISWLPIDLNFGFFQPPEPGHNFSHAETLQIVASKHRTAGRMPIVAIHHELFDLAAYRRQVLVDGATAGTVLYHMVDDLDARMAVYNHISGGSTNCMHALSDMLLPTGIPALESRLRRGFEGTKLIFNYFSPYIIEPSPDFEAAYNQVIGF